MSYVGENWHIYRLWCDNQTILFYFTHGVPNKNRCCFGLCILFCCVWLLTSKLECLCLEGQHFQRIIIKSFIALKYVYISVKGFDGSKLESLDKNTNKNCNLLNDPRLLVFISHLSGIYIKIQFINHCLESILIFLNCTRNMIRNTNSE